MSDVRIMQVDEPRSEECLSQTEVHSEPKPKVTLIVCGVVLQKDRGMGLSASSF